MKLQFKHKEYQADAVEAVVDCFAGQPKVEGVNYRLDPGKLAASRSQAELDYGTEAFRNAPLKLYAKLPKGFSVPTPVGDYNPDWAIAFDSGKTRHVFFIAETKGSMSSLELREIEKARISCARKFFARITSSEVKYDVVNSYGKLMELVK